MTFPSHVTRAFSGSLDLWILGLRTDEPRSSLSERFVGDTLKRGHSMRSMLPRGPRYVASKCGSEFWDQVKLDLQLLAITVIKWLIYFHAFHPNRLISGLANNLAKEWILNTYFQWKNAKDYGNTSVIPRVSTIKSGTFSYMYIAYFQLILQ